MSAPQTATVLGAGVAGLTVATELLRNGIRPVLIDRVPGPGPAACSWWAGGMLAPWCEAESAEPEVVTLGADAADWWESAGATVTRRGTLVVAPQRDRSEIARFARRTTEHRTVSRDEIAALEPALAGRFSTGLMFDAEAHLNPRQALAALADNLAIQGVPITEGDAPPPDATGPVFDCRGFAARDRLPELRGVKGEMVILRTAEVSLTRTIRMLHPRFPIYLVPRGDGVYMLGATSIESADRSRITARGLLELLGAAYALHPAFAEAEVIETGTDVRPAFETNMPRVLRRDGRIHVNGLYRHGYLLAPAMAREAVRVALTQKDTAA